MKDFRNWHLITGLSEGENLIYRTGRPRKKWNIEPERSMDLPLETDDNGNDDITLHKTFSSLTR